MKKHLDNKGYMLVEIILASVLAMGVAYFLTELTIKLKNKNDDLLVKTLVYTDQAIIYNTIMRDIYDEDAEFNCSNISINGNIFKYGDFTNIVSEYAELKNFNCNYDSSTGKVDISIDINVPQLPNDDFDVVINANKYGI